MILRALLIFLFLACLGIFGNAQVQTSKETRADNKLAETDFCEVLRSPKAFLNKTVVVRAIYSAGFEMGWLEEPPNCDIPVAERYASRELWDKDFEMRSEPKVTKRLHKIIRERSKKTNYRGRVLGTFEIFVREYEKTNPTDTRYLFEFVIMRVLAAEKVEK